MWRQNIGCIEGCEKEKKKEKKKVSNFTSFTITRKLVHKISYNMFQVHEISYTMFQVHEISYKMFQNTYEDRLMAQTL